MEEDLRAKAELISGGAVRIPDGYRVPVRISRSTAGPGAGKSSVVFSFGRYRVKKEIVREGGDFFFDPDSASISKDGKIIATDVRMIPVAYHCPEQAFFNLDQRCRFRCAYCGSPLLDRVAAKEMDGPKIAEMIEQSKEPVYAISITSGVIGTVGETVDRMAECVGYLRERFPDMPIGVEPYIDDVNQIDRLKAAGADEIKINTECSLGIDAKRICPDMDRDSVFDMLAHAVDVFGRGNVYSNIIMGLGETDDDLERTMRRLCGIGVAPGLRSLRVTALNAPKLKELGITEGPSPDRILRMSMKQTEIMKEYGLEVKAETMCYRCTCCDITPFMDIE